MDALVRLITQTQIARCVLALTPAVFFAGVFSSLARCELELALISLISACADT